MAKISVNYKIWWYQRTSLICLAIVFTAYGLLLRIPTHIVFLVLLHVMPSIFSPQHVCKAIPITKRIYLNYCGALLPLLIALTIFVQNIVRWDYVLLSVVFSITLSVLHTYVTDRFTLVNVPRYFIAITSLIIALLGLDTAYYLLPFAVVTGIILGTDIIPYTVMSVRSREKRKIIIGGFMALDSITLSLIFSLTILTTIKLLYTIYFY
jgi:hypothetical protein